MPRRDLHFLTGALVGAGIHAIESRRNGEPVTFSDLAIFSLGGGIMACLPDMLEPADHPNHRQFFHSLLALGLIGCGLDNTLKNGNCDERQKRVYKVLAGAYGSHLLLDISTPKGLPIG